MPTQAIAQTLNIAPLEAPSTGDVAARAFTCFDQGMRPDEVVTHLTLPADTVEYLWRTWARLRGLVPSRSRSPASCAKPCTATGH